MTDWEWPVGMMSLGDRVLHLPGNQHGITRCGANLDVHGSWKVGPFQDIADQAEYACDVCFV